MTTEQITEIHNYNMLHNNHTRKTAKQREVIGGTECVPNLQNC